MTTENSENKNTPAEAAEARCAVAAGSADWLRADADSWDKIGRFFGFKDAEEEAHNAERVAGLRAAADQIDRLRTVLEDIENSTDLDGFEEDAPDTLEWIGRQCHAALQPNTRITPTEK